LTGVVVFVVGVVRAGWARLFRYMRAPGSQCEVRPVPATVFVSCDDVVRSDLNARPGSIDVGGLDICVYARLLNLSQLTTPPDRRQSVWSRNRD
jgi:hypothetical protein